FIKNRRNKLIIKTQTDMETKTIKVEGMTCNHCKANVEKNLQMLDFVKTATVNLSDKSVTLEGDNLDMGKIKETIDGLGYKSL
ncbi:MAG: cation transporter, partial [Bacteroidales bacterium]|nr:cation transporter [Bacteroidales bacterium]